MRTFNLIKSLTRVINNRKGLLILCLSLAVFGVNEVWGAGSSYKVTPSVQPTGSGTIYLNGSTDVYSNSGEDSYSVSLSATPNDGYKFSNWTKTGDGTLDQSKATISFTPSKSKKKGEATVTANFSAITYTVAFNGNGASSGSTASQIFTYNVAQNLNANGFKKEYIVTFNADGGTADANSLTSSAPFSGWATSANGSVAYSNQQSVNNLSSTQDATINLYAKWGDYPSITLPQATKSGKVLVGWNDGKTTRLAGETYTPTSNITMTAIWMDSYPFTMSCNVSVLKVEEEKASAFTFTYADNPTPHIADASIIAYNKESNTLTGLKEGTTTIYFTQAATTTIKAGTSDTYTITVSKIANTLAADATHSMKVDETWNNVYSNKNSDGAITTESTDASIAYFDVTNNKIVAQNTNNQSFNSKEVTITISQEATYKYTAAEKTIKVTVNKHDNHIAINGTPDNYQASIYVDAQQPINLTATNTDYSGSPITATPNNDITTINTAKTQVSSHSKLGTTVWTLSQPENYKYKAANATMTINVVKQEEATDCYVLNPTSEASLNTISTGSAIAISGPADKLYFDMKYSGTIFPTLNLHAEYSTDNGNNWTEVKEINERPDNYKQFGPYSIASNATHVRFKTTVGSTNKVYYKNVRVTRKTYLNASDLTIEKTNVNEVIYPNEQGEGTITINRSLASGGNLKVAWDSDKFTINGKTAAQGLDLGNFDCATGTSTLNVVFLSDVAGTFSTPVRIYNKAYNTTVTLTGVTHERETSPFANQETSVDVSLNDQDTVTLDLTPLTDDYVGNGEITCAVISGEGTNLSGSTFYATQVGTCQVKATAAQTNKYNKAEKTITVNVVKRTPTISWKTFEHIYAGYILDDVASTSYNDKPVTLDKTYESLSPVISIDTEDKTKLHISSTITKEQEAEVKVITTETPYYKSVEGTHTYTFEPKATPVFKLNGDTLSTETTTDLYLEIGDTANVSFELTDESQFEYPQTTANNYFSYEHDAVNHTGVITATKFGNETFAFHQKGTATIFDHTCNLHIYVSKHQSSLSTPLVDGTWKVDSLYTSSLYSSNDPNEVIVSSSNDKVLKLTDEGLKAVGAGTATLYICQAATDDWTGDTISVNINVEKYTPEFTWNIDANCGWNTVFENPFSSNNTTPECSFICTSSAPSIANYVDGRIYIFNKDGDVTFTLKQLGNYCWNEKTTEYQINVKKKENHLPIYLNSAATRDAVYSGKSSKGSVSCDNNGKISLDQNGGLAVWTANPLYYTINFTGIPDKLSFTYSQSMASSTAIGDTKKSFIVYQSADGSNWVELWTSNGAAGNTSDHNVSSLALLPNTRFIKFFFDGTYAGYYKNIQVTERKEVVASTTSCDFGSANVGAATSKKSISVDWYNVQTCTLTISGTNADRFSVNPTSISSSLDNYGTADIEVSYLHTVGGSHSATLTIQSADGKSATINLSGTSNKITPTITWKENLSPMEKGSSIENPAQAAGLTFSYESSDPTVIEIINGNTLHALKKGFADITATFDGTNDVTWNSASDKTTIEVTDIKVLRIDWPQSFTNLKTDKPDITIKAEVYYYNFDDSTTVAIDRPITFTSQNTNVVTIVNGAVHIVGKGETTITATVEDVENEYVGTTVIRKVRVREPSEGCDIYVLENASGSLFTEITSFSGVEKEFNLSGEPGSITFDAWSEKWYAINPSGNLKVAEYYNGSYHTIWDQTLNVGNETSYGPIALNRKTTKIKFFKEVGSTCYHNFASAYVTLAKYLELDNTAGKTTMTVDFPESETSTDVTYTKYVDVNFSNITDVLDVDIEKGTNFKVLKQDLSSKIEEIGTDCGDKGKVTIAIQFLANEVKNYSDKITISNKDQSVTINLTAEVARHDQQITWNPTTNLLTTDQVSFSATTTATDLNVTYAIKGTSDVASVTSDGILTIYKFGEVTIVASQAGSEVYKPAVDVERTFTISRVTPTITTLPIAAEVILPKTLANCTLTGGEASVEGVFTWTNSTTNIERGNTGYEVTFTPSNLNYYTPTTCIVVVPVAKDPQTITWNFTETTMFCNADITFNATASSGLKVKYATSDASIAYVDNANHLNIIKGGEVTITAQQEGDITWAVAPEVSKVLTINRFTPTIVEIPTASPMLIGQLISNSVLTGGRAELNKVFVPGTYAWENSNTATIDVAGKTTRIVIFSPQNSNYYNSTTCEVEVEVKKYAPTITNNLTASAITYGQALSASALNGTLTAMDNVKYPSVEVDGTYTWKEPTKQLEAGNHSEVVRFTPANLDWYDVVDVEVPVVVNKAHATTATAVVNMLYGQILDEVQPINTTTDAITGIIEGTITWGAGVDVEEMPSIGEHDYPIHLAVTDPNYVAETIDGTCHVTVEKGFVFDGHGGSTEWNATGNWLGDEQPNTGDAKVIVVADATIINSEVTVGAITIKQGVDVTIEEDGILNVGNYDCVSRKEYGNMIIKQGGQLNLNEGEVQVKDFTLEAALGGIKDDARVDARSGQVTNASQLVVNGNAYFEIALDASGACTQGWYDFTVPFPVNALTGVQRYENGTLRTNLKNEVNYAIMSYHEDVRAQGKYGWSKYRGIMQPGQCYSITIDNYYNVYRFVKTTDGALNTSNEVQITATEGGENVNKGWNGIGNGTLSYANITASDIDKVQVYDHATNSYSPVEISNTTFVVGSSFFVQTPQTESVIYNKATSIGQLYAPKQTSQVSEEFMVTLSNTRTQNEVDRLYLSASEDATDSYEIGHDLAKFDVSSSVAQMWCSAYNMKLCDVELPFEYETALFPISFFAPADGEYTLSVAKMGNNEHLYLLYQGYRVTDLTMSDYVMELYKGTDTNYALQLVSTYQVPTQIENNEQENIVRKVIIDNQLYIFYDKKVYDITGKSIK